MNKYNIPDDSNNYREKLSPRQTRKLARFPSAFIATRPGSNGNYTIPIVVLDEGEKPELTSMCVPALRLRVNDNPVTGPNRVRHGAIMWHAPVFTGKIGTHNKNSAR